MPGLMHTEAEFGSLPLADHTYALDSFPSEEVPTVLAFEEVESERAQTQTLFSIVEEHAYAHRIQKLPDDDWTNLPGITAGPDSVNVGVQTDPPCEPPVPAPVPAPAPAPTEPDSSSAAAAATATFVRFVSATVSPSVLAPLREAAARLGIAITVSGPRLRCRRLPDLLRLLSAVEPPPPARPKTSARKRTSEAPKAKVRQRSGRVASSFDLEKLLGPEEGPASGTKAHPEPEPEGGFRCTDCGLVVTTRGSLSRHQRTCPRRSQPLDRPFVCSKCPASYKRADSLREHCFVKHRDGNTPPKFAFQCSSCFKTFKRKSVLQDHMNRHLGALTYSCPFCGQRFTGRALLRYHVYSRHPDAVDRNSR